MNKIGRLERERRRGGGVKMRKGEERGKEQEDGWEMRMMQRFAPPNPTI